MSTDGSMLPYSRLILDQHGQTVNAPQAMVAGDNSGTLINGPVNAPVHVGDVIYQWTRPLTPDPVQLDQARAALAALPLDALPEPAALPPGSRVPLARNPLFVGRADDLRDLARLLTPETSPAPCVALTGLGGSGKSQLAVEFSHRYGRYFAGGVFWLNLANAAGVPGEVALAGLGLGLGLDPRYATLSQPEQLALVAAAWQSPVPRLLIFDNCEDEALLAAWRPPTGGCRVIVTSRRAQWEATLGVSVLPLGVLARAESVALLGAFRPDLLSTQTHLDELAAEVGDLPLALHLVGSFLQRYRHAAAGRPEAVLAQLRRPDRFQQAVLEGQGAKVSPTGHALHVARTFALSYDQLDPGDDTDAIAQALLTRIACLAPGQPIPHELMLAVTNLWGDAALELQIEDALLRLSALGLVALNDAGSVTLHRLVGTYACDAQAAELADHQSTVEAVIEQRAGQVNASGLPGSLRAWVGHLRHVVEQADARGSDAAGRLWAVLGSHLSHSGDYVGAQRAFERALHIDEAALGPEHVTVAHDANQVAVVLRARGDLAGAREMIERALRIGRATLGEEHPTVAGYLATRGVLRRDQGDWAGARSDLERALEVTETTWGNQDDKVADLMNGLGLVLRDQGDLDGARMHFERAVQIQEATLGAGHPGLALSLNNLGLLRQTLGNWAGARDDLERALGILEATLGPEHPYVAICVNNLGSVLQAQGDLAAAAQAYERALHIDEARLGPDHRRVATSLNNLASVRQAQGDGVGAKALFERVSAIIETALGPAHPDLIIPLYNLGAAHLILGDGAAARGVLERALGLAEAALGPEHPTVGTVIGELGRARQRLGDLEGARQAYERALRIKDNALGPEHPDVAAQLIYLAGVLRPQGDLAGARHAIGRALQVQEKALGPAHRDVAATLVILATVLAGQGETQGALEALQRAEAIRAQT